MKPRKYPSGRGTLLFCIAANGTPVVQCDIQKLNYYPLKVGKKVFIVMEGKIIMMLMYRIQFLVVCSAIMKRQTLH